MNFYPVSFPYVFQKIAYNRQQEMKQTLVKFFSLQINTSDCLHQSQSECGNLVASLTKIGGTQMYFS